MDRSTLSFLSFNWEIFSFPAYNILYKSLLFFLRCIWIFPNCGWSSEWLFMIFYALMSILRLFYDISTFQSYFMNFYDFMLSGSPAIDTCYHKSCYIKYAINKPFTQISLNKRFNLQSKISQPHLMIWVNCAQYTIYNSISTRIIKWLTKVTMLQNPGIFQLITVIWRTTSKQANVGYIHRLTSSKKLAETLNNLMVVYHTTRFFDTIRRSLRNCLFSVTRPTVEK